MKEDHRGSGPAGVLVVQVNSGQRQVWQDFPSFRKGWTNQAVAGYAAVPFRVAATRPSITSVLSGGVEEGDVYLGIRRWRLA